MREISSNQYDRKELGWGFIANGVGIFCKKYVSPHIFIDENINADVYIAVSEQNLNTISMH